MKIYYERQGKRIGPKSITDLDPLELERDTLVWFEGQTDWTKAYKIAELDGYFKSAPPALPQSPLGELDERFDTSYKKETRVTVFGIFLLFFPFIVAIIGFYSLPSHEYSSLRMTFPLIALVIRVFVCVFVIQIAKRQNRDKVIWGILGFIFPSISLIVIGLLKKLKASH